MSQSKTSVIIPAYNSASFIHKAIDSALQQTVRPLEIIIVDDGSKDQTCDFLQRYENQIILIRQNNAGPAAARNVGMEIAKGEYIAFLDADDYWLPHFIEKTQQFLDLHQEAVAVSTGWKVHLLNGKALEFPTDSVRFSLKNSESVVLDDFYDFWAEHNHILTGTVSFRRTVLVAISGQRTDLRISEDLEFWAMLASQGKWGMIPEKLWLGDSQIVSAQHGWTQHYQLRHQLCPTLESWQQRLILHGIHEHSGFRRIRGHVALNFCHVALLNQNTRLALQLINEHGQEFPDSRLSYLILFFAQWGSVGNWISSKLLRVNFAFKSYRGKRIFGKS